MRFARDFGRRFKWFALRRFGDSSPIIIYQMGKVGSTTVYKSLESADLGISVHHAHFLSWEGIQDAENYFLSLQKPKMPAHIARSKQLREEIDRAGVNRWRIITLVREPIGWHISNFFQNVDAYYPDLVAEDGSLKADEAVEFLQHGLATFDEHTDYASNWFDREMKRVFDVDVYDHPFDHEKGFVIIPGQNVRLLVLRLENLDRSFRQAMRRFIGPWPVVRVVRSNVGTRKKHAEAYEHVLGCLVVPESVCARVYASKYARHFYTEQMRDNLTRKWSRG